MAAKMTFTWDRQTKYEDMPKWLLKLIPGTADLTGLDEENQVDHIRYRVQHEVDIAEEEGLEETGMTRKEHRNAIKFLVATGGRK